MDSYIAHRRKLAINKNRKNRNSKGDSGMTAL
jgi:hypothetical protein